MNTDWKFYKQWGRIIISSNWNCDLVRFIIASIEVDRKHCVPFKRGGYLYQKQADGWILSWDQIHQKRKSSIQPTPNCEIGDLGWGYPRVLRALTNALFEWIYLINAALFRWLHPRFAPCTSVAFLFSTSKSSLPILEGAALPWGPSVLNWNSWITALGKFLFRSNRGILLSSILLIWFLDEFGYSPRDILHPYCFITYLSYWFTIIRIWSQPIN